MPVLIFLFINFIVAAAAFTITYRLLKKADFADSLICWFIFYFAQIVFTELVLGILGMLYLENVILINLSLLLIVRLVANKHPCSFDLKPVRDILPGLLNSKTLLLGACVILCFGGVKIFINLINPPFGWDSLNYHFTFPVEWLKHSNLNNPITIFDDPSPSYYPIGGGLFYLWLIFPFKSVFLADIGQLAFFILSFVAAYSISRKIDLSREFSFCAAILFCVIPNYFKQLQIAYVDVMVAALFLACLNCLFLLNREVSFKNMSVWSLAMGLFLGTKTIALPYAALLFLPFIYLAVKNINKIYLFIISIFIITAMGGFPYLRNFMETGNPLYPLNLNLFGKVVLKGVIDGSSYRAHFKITDYRLAKLLFHEGLGLQTLIFVLPSTLLALPVAWIKIRKSLTFYMGYFLALPVLIYLVYRYAIPLANTRYLYPLLGVGVILGFYTAKNMKLPGKLINILSVLCFLSSMAELAKRQELVVSLILTVFLFLSFIFFRRHKLVISIRKPVLIPFIAILAVISLILLQNDYIKNEYRRYTKMVKYSGFWPDATRAWEWLNKNTKDDNIAYAGRPVPFPLYGTNFKNNVYYVSVNKTDPAKLHYFPDSRYTWNDDFLDLHKNLEAKGNYRADADCSVWLSNLVKRKTDYLFIYSLHQTKDIIFPMEDNWARENPGKFFPVFVNPTIHIYKIAR